MQPNPILAAITRGPVIRPPRLIIVGEPKIGKSTWAAQAAAPVILPVKGEEGVDAIDAAKLPTARTFADALAALSALREEPHDFKTVVIDSVSALEPLLWDETCRRNQWQSIEQGYARGYIEALTEWRHVLDLLDALRTERGMTSIIIGHAKIRTVSTPETEPFDAWAIDLDGRAAALLSRWADFVGFAGRQLRVRHTDLAKANSKHGDTSAERVAMDSGERYLFTQRTATHPGGGRGAYGRLPDALPLDMAAFRAAVKAVFDADKAARDSAQNAQTESNETTNTDNKE